MDQCNSVSSVKDESSLTPGEQRILALMGQGFGRLEQRMDRLELRQERLELRQERLEMRQTGLEEKLEAQTKQLLDLTCRVTQEAAASKQRDRQLSADLQRLREEAAARDTDWRQTFHREMNAFRVEVSEKFDHHNTRLEMLEQGIERTNVGLRQLDQRLGGVQQEQRKLSALLGREYAPHGQPPLTS
jgi:chromosome segregation ATPase